MNKKSTSKTRPVVARKVEPVVGPDRDVLALRLYKSGMTYRQVGEIIGVSQSRARVLCLRELRRPAWEKMMARKTYDCDVFAVVVPERKHIEYMTNRLWDAKHYISSRKGNREIIRGTFRPNIPAETRPASGRSLQPIVGKEK